jgi:hypothetical protein
MSSVARLEAPAGLQWRRVTLPSRLTIEGQDFLTCKVRPTNDENSKCLRGNHAVGEVPCLLLALFHWYPF